MKLVAKQAVGAGKDVGMGLVIWNRFGCWCTLWISRIRFLAASIFVQYCWLLRGRLSTMGAPIVIPPKRCLRPCNGVCNKHRILAGLSNKLFCLVLFNGDVLSSLWLHSFLGNSVSFPGPRFLNQAYPNTLPTSKSGSAESARLVVQIAGTFQ